MIDAAAAARAELLDRIGHFTLTPRLVIDLGGGLGPEVAGLQERFPAARIVVASLTDDDSALGARQPPRTGWRRAWEKLRARLGGPPPAPERIETAVDRLPFASGSVDLVVAHWLRPDPSALDAMLAELRRVLVPGGLFLWSTPGGRPRTADALPADDDFDLHGLGSALGHAGFVEPVLDIDRHVDGEVIHAAAFAGNQPADDPRHDSAAFETSVPVTAIGRRARQPT